MSTNSGSFLSHRISRLQVSEQLILRIGAGIRQAERRAFAGEVAWQGLGQEILNVDFSGGAPFRPSFHFANVIGQMDQGTDNVSLRTISSAMANWLPCDQDMGASMCVYSHAPHGRNNNR